MTALEIETAVGELRRATSDLLAALGTGGAWQEAAALDALARRGRILNQLACEAESTVGERARPLSELLLAALQEAASQGAVAGELIGEGKRVAQEEWQHLSRWRDTLAMQGPAPVSGGEIHVTG